MTLFKRKNDYYSLNLRADQQENLFKPFHSTKASGTGLGLHFAHKALAEFHGTITYEERQPNGARFIIKLPPMKEKLT